ncbi:aminopeptidase N-like [Haematobia irritans]|uniref:aminopeptidase N-like n=1 Tax=Haematobia irritans TaxID=7368 RepID=UPI003F4F9AE1
MDYLPLVLAVLMGIVTVTAEGIGYTHYRLPTALDPWHYTLKIITILDGPENLNFSGSVAIKFRVLEDTQNITLHSRNLSINESRIQLRRLNQDEEFNFCLEKVEILEEHDYYIIELCQTLHKGEEYEVELHFSGILNFEFQGYFFTSYEEEMTNETKWIAVTQFEPTYARNAFPCWDEPNYKANYTLWLGHNKTLLALANMPMERQIPLEGMEDDFVWSIFEESIPMSSYLVAFSIHDFASRESKVEGSNVTFRTWCRKDYIDHCEYGAQAAPIALKFYEQMFGISFPLKKVDQIAIPRFTAYAMENWGLITYEESALLYEPNVTTLLQKTPVTTVIAHELAHQWFGNLVTMKWWTDLWLNEGFATYVASLGVAHLNPESNSYNTISLENLIDVFDTDAKASSHPVSELVWNSSKILDRFDSISYGKGSAILRMMHLTMGGEAFFAAIREYLTKYQYVNAQQDDLWHEFSEKFHELGTVKQEYNVKAIMDTWTLFSGYPLVKVKRNYDTGSLEISQERFLKSKSLRSEDNLDNKCWWIPLSYSISSELSFNVTTPKAWLECNESGQSLPLHMENVAKNTDWIIFNNQMAGVYRVSYDSENWRLIAETLNSDHYLDIHVMNRAQILSDVLALAFQGHHGHYDIAFSILEYLTKERENLPWRVALNGLSDIWAVIKFLPMQRRYFNLYMQYILEPIYYYTGGLNSTSSMDHLTESHIKLKPVIAEWACTMEIDDCIHSAQQQFQEWKHSQNPDEENPIDVDMRHIIYCMAIRYGNQSDWKFLWQRYRKTSSQEDEMFRIIKGLSCSRDSTLLSKFLVSIYIKGFEIGDYDDFVAFQAIALSEVGADVAREYFFHNLESLKAAKKDIDLMVDCLSETITTAEDLEKLINFIETNNDHFSDVEYRKKYVRSLAQPNIEWIDRNLENMKEQLQIRLSGMGVLEENAIHT